MPRRGIPTGSAESTDYSRAAKGYSKTAGGRGHQKLVNAEAIHHTAEGGDIMVERMLPFVEKVIGASSGNG